MLFCVLTQGAKTTFFLANGEFQFLVEAIDAVQVLGTEKLKQKRGYLREITENVFYFGGEPLIFGAFDHDSLLPKQ